MKKTIFYIFVFLFFCLFLNLSFLVAEERTFLQYRDLYEKEFDFVRCPDCGEIYLSVKGSNFEDIHDGISFRLAIEMAKILDEEYGRYLNLEKRLQEVIQQSKKVEKNNSCINKF